MDSLWRRQVIIFNLSHTSRRELEQPGGLQGLLEALLGCSPIVDAEILSDGCCLVTFADLSIALKAVALHGTIARGDGSAETLRIANHAPKRERPPPLTPLGKGGARAGYGGGRPMLWRKKSFGGGPRGEAVNWQWENGSRQTGGGQQEVTNWQRGIVCNWNPDRGFGFIRPVGALTKGTDDAFFIFSAVRHREGPNIAAFAAGLCDGFEVDYTAVCEDRDGQRRLRAKEVLLVGRPPPPRGSAVPGPISSHGGLQRGHREGMPRDCPTATPKVKCTGLTQTLGQL
jgi:cold shock CspA family protein